MKIDWKKKLTSRKFLFAIAGFVSGLIITFNGNSALAENIYGCILSGASVVAYIIGEAMTDSANKQ